MCKGGRDILCLCAECFLSFRFLTPAQLTDGASLLKDEPATEVEIVKRWVGEI